jgi:hypothetical protein
MYTVFIMETSQDLVPRGGIFLGKWRSSFARSSNGKMNVQSACAPNTPYFKCRKRTVFKKFEMVNLTSNSLLYSGNLLLNVTENYVETMNPGLSRSVKKERVVGYK